MKTTEFDPNNPSHISSSVSIWNLACGADLSVAPRFFQYNTHPPTGAIQAGQLAIVDEQPIGFVLASALPNDPKTSPPEIGWIDAIAVAPSAQKRGAGSALLKWAEAWLRAQNCTRVRLGGGLRPFLPGYPTELRNISFFRKRGYAEREDSATVWDVARDLEDFRKLGGKIDAQICPAQHGDEKALLQFLRREFPGRWRFEFDEFLRDQRSSLDERGRMSDYVILLTQRGVDGFARLNLEDSERPIERFYMHHLPRPWGQLGPIGVSVEMRGKRMGSALLDAALCHLRDSGVRGCVIDWTNLPDFYSKFGFERYREYEILLKNIGG